MIYLARLGCDGREKSRELLFAAVKMQFGIELSKGDIKADENGKPYDVKGRFFFNLSHSGDIVVCALSKYPCGVDVEKIKDLSQGLIARMTEEEERAQISDSATAVALWCLKESYLKKTGKGLSGGLKTAVFRLGEKKDGRVTSNRPERFYLYGLEDAYLALCLDEKEDAES
jgi:4'-phosphopantetheinyl transferase